MGGQGGENCRPGAWRQQAEQGAGNSDLSSKARQARRPPWGSLCEKHHVTLRNLILCSSEAPRADAASAPAEPSQKAGCVGANEPHCPFLSTSSPKRSKCWWLKDQEQHQRKGSYVGTSLLL